MPSGCHLMECFSQPRICSNPACANHMLYLCLLQRQFQTRNQRIDHRAAKCRGKRGLVDFLAFLFGVVHQIDYCGFQTGKRKVQWGIFYLGMRERIFGSISLACHCIDFRTARVSHAKHAGNFIQKPLPPRRRAYRQRISNEV